MSILAVLVPGLAAAQSAEPSADVKPKFEIIAGVAMAHVSGLKTRVLEITLISGAVFNVNGLHDLAITRTMLKT
jgi:hypothetical protein